MPTEWARLVFAEPAFVDSGELSQFVGAKADFRQHFAQALGGGKAVCGNLPAEQRSALFGAGEFPGSAVIMPFLGKQWQGVLVIASNDPRRFEPGMSTDFLDYLRDVRDAGGRPLGKAGRGVSGG